MKRMFFSILSKLFSLSIILCLSDSAFAKQTAHSRGNLSAAEYCLGGLACPEGTYASLDSLVPSSNCGGGAFCLNGKCCWKATCSCQPYTSAVINPSSPGHGDLDSSYESEDIDASPGLDLLIDALVAEGQ